MLISTPYGSTGYFGSVVRKKFEKGLGLAFNNPVKKIKNRILNDKSVVNVKVLRGPGTLTVDCSKEIIKLKTGDIIRIKKSGKYAKLIQLKGKKLKCEV